MTYVYYCKKCNKEIEINHSMKENPTIICEDCKETMTRKILGGTGFLMKGSLSSTDKYLGTKMEQFQQNPESDPYRKWRD
jgi:putative FmdB family regulatory protein